MKSLLRDLKRGCVSCEFRSETQPSECLQQCFLEICCYITVHVVHWKLCQNEEKSIS